MAFHGRRGNRVQSGRRGQRESIVGLAGWLFADLLLALSAVFLVAQDRPGSQKLEEKIAELSVKADRLDELCKKDLRTCGGASGLKPEVQLIVDIDGGAASRLTVSQLRKKLEQGRWVERKTGTDQRDDSSWAQLKKEDKRIGLVILFTHLGNSAADEAAEKFAELNRDSLVRALIGMGLVDPVVQQLGDQDNYDTSRFPIIPRYRDTEVGTGDLRLLALTFKYTPLETSS